MKKITVILLTSSALLGGCTTPHSEAPIATNPATSQQLKLQAASHWQLIAEDTAAQLIAALPEKRPMHVLQRPEASSFEKAFNSQLVGILTAAGYPVMRQPGSIGALQLEVSATPVQFSRDRLQGRYAGGATTLAGGLWVLRNIYSNVSPGAGMMAGALAIDATDWLRSEYANGPTPRTELLVNVSVYNSERYFAQTNNAYYTSDDNWGLYAQNVLLPVKGGK